MNSESTTPAYLEAIEEAAQWCVHLESGELSAAQRRALEAWLQIDPRHREYLDDALMAWHAIDTQSSQPDMLALRSAALEDLRRVQGADQVKKSHRAQPWWGVAAALTIAVSTVIAWLYYAPETYRTADGERRVLELSDGSIVSLDAGTILEVRYSAGRRNLSLRQGRARFAVASDPLRPFAVAADDSVVVATGTEFSVERLSRQTRVVLFEGRVAVLEDADQGESHGRHVALTPGQELVLDKDHRERQILQTDLGDARAWQEGKLVFADEALDLAVERVNRYSARKILIADERIAQFRISGVFVAGDIGAFVDGVAAVFPVEAKTVDTGAVLTLDARRQGKN